MMKFFLALLTLASPLAAMVVGKNGDPFVKNGISWQPVHYIDNEVGFSANLPGEPHSGIAGENIYSNSTFDDVVYEIHCNYNKRYNPPKKAEFIKQLKEIFANKAEIVPLQDKIKNVLYAAEIQFHNKEKLCRVYCSQNQLYWAIIEGDDFSLSEAFFNSIKVLK